MNVSPLGLGGLTYGLSTVEMAAAYAAFANSGVYNEPKTYVKVLANDNSTVVLEKETEQRVAMKETTAYLMTDMLRRAGYTVTEVTDFVDVTGQLLALAPDLVLLDTDILAKAPIRFLVAGMGDALSTYPECRANVQSASPNYVNSGYHQTIACIAVSKACHETILTKGVSAKLAAEQGLCTKDVEDVIEANTLLSGLGVQNGSCAGAHSIAEGITVLEPCAKLLHGEVVAFGILVQLIVEAPPPRSLTSCTPSSRKWACPPPLTIWAFPTPPRPTSGRWPRPPCTPTGTWSPSPSTRRWSLTAS